MGDNRHISHVEKMQINYVDPLSSLTPASWLWALKRDSLPNSTVQKGERPE